MIARHVVTAKDFEVLQSFWLAKGLPEVPLAHVPEFGVVIEEHDNIICGAYLVKSDAGIASIAYLAANPSVSKDLRHHALSKLLFELTVLARELGFSIICAATNVPALQKRYEEFGLTKTDENVTHYVGRV